MNQNKLDKFDLKLLQELERNARQPITKIAKKLKTSQQVISYRIKSLEKRKIITEYYTIINLTKIGYTSYRTMIRFSSINETKSNQIINYLTKNPNTLWLVECTGRWDLIVNFAAKNIIHYNEILNKLKNKFPKQIQNYDVLTTLEATYFGRNYFSNEKRNPEHLPRFGKEYNSTKLKNKDLQILNLISENARKSSVEIANQLNISPNTVISKIKNLEKTGLIQGFKPLIHLEKTPYSGYKALIKFQNITKEKEKEIMEFLKTNKNIVGTIKLIGQWDFEIELETENQEQLLKTTREFRDKFKNVIKDFETLQLFREYKYNFFPKDILFQQT